MPSVVRTEEIRATKLLRCDLLPPRSPPESQLQLPSLYLSLAYTTVPAPFEGKAQEFVTLGTEPGRPALVLGASQSWQVCGVRILSRERNPSPGWTVPHGRERLGRRKLQAAAPGMED